MRENPQELVGVKQRQDTTEASSKDKHDCIHLSQVIQENQRTLSLIEGFKFKRQTNFIQGCENVKAESYMLCTHLSYWANPHPWAWLQAAWTSSQVCTSHPCAGTSPSPSTAVLSSFQGVQATPEKHSPNNHKHQTSATKITFVRETSCAPGTRGKKLSFEATSFGKH